MTTSHTATAPEVTTSETRIDRPGQHFTATELRSEGFSVNVFVHDDEARPTHKSVFCHDVTDVEVEEGLVKVRSEHGTVWIHLIPAE